MEEQQSQIHLGFMPWETLHAEPSCRVSARSRFPYRV